MKKVALAVFALLISPSLFAADKASFHFGATRFDVADMLAYQQKSGEKKTTVILMSDFKIDRDAVSKAIRPEDALYAQSLSRENSNFLVITLSEPGKCEVNAVLGQGQQQIGLASAELTAAKSDPARVAGTCHTKEPGKMFDDAYDYQLPFDLAVTPIEPPSSLPAGGGAPGAALSAVVKAIQANDWKVARLHLREVEIANEPKPTEMKDYFESLALNYPKTITVTGGLQKGDLAQVEMKGTDREGKKLEGTFSMKKIGGNWRVVEQYLHYAE